MSFLWGLDVILREGYIGKGDLLWSDYPNHPMIFLHKLYFIIQLAYYLHMLPELYFQKVKKEEQQAKIIHAILGFSFVAFAFVWGFQRIALVLLTLHYFGEFLTHIFALIEIFDRDDKLRNLSICHQVGFGITRSSTMILAVLALFYGLESTEYTTRGYVALFGISSLQGHLAFQFFKDILARRRAENSEQNQAKKGVRAKLEKSKKDRKRESDLPEADQPKADAKKGK